MLDDRLPFDGTDGLVVDWCSIHAARYAVMNWHYSKRLPSSKVAKLGVWESGQFVGAVLFGRGASPYLGSPFGLEVDKLCELTRVALTTHVTPTSQIVARALRVLKVENPGLRLVVSFADEGQGHLGVLYQAGNWVYTGLGLNSVWFRVNGVIVHPKTLYSRYGEGGQAVGWLRENVDPDACRVQMPPKHRYVYPLDRAMRRQLRPMSRPYPTETTTLVDAVEGSMGAGALPG